MENLIQIQYPVRVSGKSNSCGDCRSCCIVFPIESLNKQAGEPCKNLGKNGCMIYDDSSRPPECKEFDCRFVNQNVRQLLDEHYNKNFKRRIITYFGLVKKFFNP